ncbi:methyltransferase domain-containing protein [Yinghuangia sp. YIM S09857]|uniref:methyltransferase domain-containing protein n=1 Tax=Yinghuangia sp. YIM S09857 TaxID=3436929 RepID=UPI003F537F7E
MTPTDNASVRLLGRDRTPFLPGVVWAWESSGLVRLDRREDPIEWQSAAAGDRFLITQWDDGASEDTGGVASCSASMPTVVVSMLDACDVRSGMRVLEIGTGTGYTAALLKDRVGDGGSVVSVEVDPVLAVEARARLDGVGVDVEVICGDGAEGWAIGAPYDRVHVTCAVRRIPTAWLDQCPQGRIMLPWGAPFSQTEHVVGLDVADGRAVGRFGDGVSFMYLRSQRPDRWPDDWPEVGEPLPAGAPGDEVGEPLGGFGEFVVGAMMPGVRHLVADDDTPGVRDLWLARDDTYAVIAFGDGHPTTLAGDSALGRTYLDAVRWWHDHGRPEASGFGLAVVAAGERAGQSVWFGTPDGPTWPHQ